MSVAIPRLMVDLGIPATSAQWLTTAFLLTMAVVIPITGLLMQRFHTRQVFLIAMSLFVIGTVVATVSPGFELLLVARVIQASGTALMVPLLMTTAMTLEPPETRGRRMGSITVVISVAPAIGPTISGLVLNALPWRFLFAIILPVAVAALIVGAVRMPNVTEPRPTPIDALSVVLSAVGFGGLVFGLSHFGESGGTLDPTVLAPLVVAPLQSLCSSTAKRSWRSTTGRSSTCAPSRAQRSHFRWPSSRLSPCRSSAHSSCCRSTCRTSSG
jgi:DHA2 family lincomycin resistance protein-like MFS transporter